MADDSGRLNAATPTGLWVSAIDVFGQVSEKPGQTFTIYCLLLHLYYGLYITSNTIRERPLYMCILFVYY